jgi:hypothetical protein
MITEDDVDAFLEHHGVKGMHWGVRKERTASDVQKDLDRIERSRNSVSRKVLPATSVLAGAGARAGTAKKVLKLKEVKNPDGSIKLIKTSKTPDITPENRADFDRKIDQRAYLNYVVKGSAVTATLLAAAYVGHTRISDPGFASLAVKGSLFLAGAQGLHTAGVTAGIHRNIKDRQLSEQKRTLKKELKIKTPNTKP